MPTASDKIRELHQLHQDGLLSSDEFKLRRNAILDALHAAPAPSQDSRAGTEIGLMAGQEIGPRSRRYRLERLIARGGVAQVWQATDLATHAELGHSAQVALKILAPELTRNAAYARLLVEEAARARRLAHEHIVRVYDWAQDPATSSYFLIMECLDGEDLDALLAREGSVTLARALELLAPVAAALDYAWTRHRLVHRDIKPGNVFVTRRGEVKLLDFGIAARARGTGVAPATEAPASSGTAGYRAPEAGMAGREPLPALDVHAVAVMISQMVSGSLPFGAARVPGEQPVMPPALGPRQWEALQTGFAFDAEARPATVGELLQRIRAADATPAQAEPVRKAVKVQDPEESARRTAEAKAAAAAQAQLVRERREREKQERAAQEAVRRERKEALRQQLLARRREEAEKARLAREEAEQARRKAQKVKAAAAILEQQKQARTAAQAEALAAPDTPAREAEPVASPGSLLRDHFRDSQDAGPELVLLPAGRFQMGSPEHERKIATAAGAQQNWLARETPQHWVGIERPFALGRYPVTVGEWRVFARATGWRCSGEVDWEAPGFAQNDAHPVVGVTWHDARQYLHWLSERTGQRYRLPSEAEWEYACRAGTKTAFSCGDSISTDLANYDGNFCYNGGPPGVYRKGTTAVGTFPPNPWGLFDMHGNVWEWVQDVVHDSYDGAPVDGSAWEEGGDQARRILRGGSWLYNPRYLRSALRNGFSAVLANDIVGFRVARDVEVVSKLVG
ncbi:SUMF1/EgtB/PvdO family nonheme iron enzyme [Massilia horti]|uniref:Serine/threonine protein kinase n=1 Tax=Massilia horti TaxID=2562153 RepID=A0A4Y9SYP5_9BURK|nr:SUMF1/EgtB/PvdO family nonheme iron enzyme [Massilia horti]TFW31872.1 serine/threonine protein kinase [Massilia horti]